MTGTGTGTQEGVRIVGEENTTIAITANNTVAHTTPHQHQNIHMLHRLVAITPRVDLLGKRGVNPVTNEECTGGEVIEAMINKTTTGGEGRETGTSPRHLTCIPTVTGIGRMKNTMTRMWADLLAPVGEA